jgi:hypothetical protein
MAGIFATWQPAYAEAGIATFPVRNKRPAVKGYLKAGLKASGQFRDKFQDDDAFGFACRPNHITVLDIDDPDERLLCDALSEFGPTPIIVRSGSGNHQAWYRNAGEKRRIRPDPLRPIDILGDGFVVAPPSDGKRQPYELIQGSLADLGSLPRMRRIEAPEDPFAAHSAATASVTPIGQRNDALFRHCMMKARSCRKIDELMEIAVQTNNNSFYEPLPDSEVLRVVASAWSKQLSGQNWFGEGRRVAFSHEEIDNLLFADPDAFALLTILKRNHWGRNFFAANAMAKMMPGGGWTVKRLAGARKRLEISGEIKVLRDASSYHGPALYAFKGGQI